MPSDISDRQPALSDDVLAGTLRLMGEPDLDRDPHGWYDRLRDQYRMALTDAGPDPVWVPTHYEDVYRAFRNTELFSTSTCIAFEPRGLHRWIPTEIDGQEHNRYRQLLAPFFGPPAVAALEPRIREIATMLLDEIEAKGRCEYLSEFGERLPSMVFMEIYGLPIEEGERFLDWIRRMTPRADDPEMKERLQARSEIYAYVADMIRDRRRSPGEDLISYLTTAEVDGVPITDDDLLEMGFQLYLAGLGTVTSVLGYGMYHFATNPSDRQRIVDDPSLIPSAVEEILRFYSPVTTGRVVTEDTEYDGCPMRAGDRVYLVTSAANRDEIEFPQAETFDLTRSPNRHIAFGAGPHRCLGSFLARADLASAFQLWHERIPNYRIAADTQPTGHGGTLFALNQLFLEWD